MVHIAYLLCIVHTYSAQDGRFAYEERKKIASSYNIYNTAHKLRISNNLRIDNVHVHVHTIFNSQIRSDQMDMKPSSLVPCHRRGIFVKAKKNMYIHTYT